MQGISKQNGTAIELGSKTKAKVGMCSNEMILSMQNLHPQNGGVFVKKLCIARLCDEI